MKTPEQINAESLFAIHFRAPDSDEWKIYRHITGKGYQEAMRLYRHYRDGALSGHYSNMMDMHTGQIVASSAPASVYATWQTQTGTYTPRNAADLQPMFRDLDDDETREFRQWARDTYVPGSPISPVWHPAVRDECQRMNAERDDA